MFGRRTKGKMAVIPMSLADVKITGLPSSAFYIADFISEEEERVLLEKVIFLHRNSYMVLY